MAVIANLHDVAQIMAEHIGSRLGFADVQPGNPRPVTATNTVGVRLTLLYVTPQPHHRNDPWERGAAAERLPPPITLSCFILVTTSGADSEDPIAAQNALGEVLKLYQDQPALHLPLVGIPGSPAPTLSALGEGTLSVVPVPVPLDQLDKIWTPLDSSLQPFMLFELGPVQLVPLRAPEPPAPVVAPGGVPFTVRALGTRPLIAEISPAFVRGTGWLRIDLARPMAVQAVLLDGIAVPPGAFAVLGSAILLDCTTAGAPAPGMHVLTVLADGVFSAPAPFRVGSPGAALLDTPPAPIHDSTTDLLLTGTNLATADAAFAWPPAGIRAPDEVVLLRLTAVADGGATLTAASAAPLEGLTALAARGATWRVALRIPNRGFTPFVRLEFAA